MAEKSPFRAISNPVINYSLALILLLSEERTTIFTYMLLKTFVICLFIVPRI